MENDNDIPEEIPPIIVNEIIMGEPCVQYNQYSLTELDEIPEEIPPIIDNDIFLG